MSLWKKWTKAAGFNTEVAGWCSASTAVDVINQQNNSLRFQGLILQSKWDVFPCDLLYVLSVLPKPSDLLSKMIPLALKSINLAVLSSSTKPI